MEPAFRSSIARLTACCWETASLTRDGIASVRKQTRVHGESPTLLASCQRIEVYGTGGCGCEAPVQITGLGALRHLAEVATGLHSLVLGEAEILGQARAALAVAPPEVRAAGDLAIAAARELRRQTAFNSHSGHMLDRALAHCGVEATGTALVIGAGAIGRLVALRAQEIGFERVVIAARRVPEAAWFVDGAFDYVPLGELAGAPAVEVAIGCLGSAADELDPARDLPGVRRLVVDLGTPRNFAPTDDIRMVGIADMLNAPEGRHHTEGRRAALREQLHRILDRRLAMAADTSHSPVGALRASVESSRLEEVARIRRLHPDIPAETVDAITRGLVNRVLHLPSERLRALDDDTLARELADLFAPGDEGADHE